MERKVVMTRPAVAAEGPRRRIVKKIEIRQAAATDLNECVCVCGCEEAEITEEDENGHSIIKIRVPKVTRDESGEPDALAKAAGVSDALGNLSGEVSKLVRRARAQGSTWTEIGTALGVSKQAAWERFSDED